MGQSYRDLVVWQHAMALVTHVYRATQRFPREEIYGLTSQIRRAAVSVPSNIAEGQGRTSRGEFYQFLGHARGSLYETQTQLMVAQSLQYLAASDAEQLLENSSTVARLLNALMASIEPAK